MHRTVIATSLFFGSLFVLVGIPFVVAVRKLTAGKASGIGLVSGSAGENLVRVLIVAIVAALAYWLSGKL